MKLLEESLINKKLIDLCDLETAHKNAAISNKPLLEFLIDLKYIKFDNLKYLLKEEFNINSTMLMDSDIDINATSVIPQNISAKLVVFPMELINNNLLLSMSNPFDIEAQDTIRAITSKDLEIIFCTRSRILQCIKTYYSLEEKFNNWIKDTICTNRPILGKFTKEIFASITQEFLDHEEYVTLKIIDYIISFSLNKTADFIHIKPGRNITNVYCISNAHNHPIIQIPTKQIFTIITKLKILCNLDTTQKKQIQKGYLNIYFDQENVTMNILFLPDKFSETIEIKIVYSDKMRNRILTQESAMSSQDIFQYDQKGNSSENIELYSRIKRKFRTSDEIDIYLREPDIFSIREKE